MSRNANVVKIIEIRWLMTDFILKKGYKCSSGHLVCFYKHAYSIRASRLLLALHSCRLKPMSLTTVILFHAVLYIIKSNMCRCRCELEFCGGKNVVVSKLSKDVTGWSSICLKSKKHASIGDVKCRSVQGCEIKPTSW